MQTILNPVWPLGALTAPLDATAADPASPSDEALLLAYRRGNEDAFRALYLRHRDRVWRFIRRLISDANQAEETVQEVWLAVVAGKHAFAQRAKFTTWLFAIAHRRAIERLRRSGRNLEATQDDWEGIAPQADADANPDSLAQNEQDAKRLQRAIAALPLHQRDVFLMRSEGGLDIGEIAAAIGCPHETAKTRLRYAYAKLRYALEGDL